MLTALGLFLAGALGPIVLRVEQRLELPADETALLVEALARELRARDGQPVIAPEGIDCGHSSDRCVSVLRAATGAQDVLLMRLIGGPKRIRLIAERIRPGLPALSAELSLQRDPAEWSGPLREAIGRLFPSSGGPAILALESPPSAGAGWRRAAWPLLLGGLLLAGGGVGFYVDHSDARQALDRRMETDAEFRADLARSNRSGTLAAVLLPLGAAALVGCVALLVVP